MLDQVGQQSSHHNQNGADKRLVRLHSSSVPFHHLKRGPFINRRLGARLREPATFPNLTHLA